MKERELRDLFISSLKSGHMQGNIFEGGIDQEFKHENLLFRYEYYFRSFDLVVIRILKGENPGPSFLDMQEMVGLENLLVRNNLLNHCARAEKSRVERIQFYPVELKSDDDVLDARLPNQLLNAILTFGRSIIVLDYNHSKRVVRDRMLNLFPCTVVAYTGKEDYFQMLYFYNRFVTNTYFDMPRRRIAKILYDNGLGAKVNKMYKVLSIVQKINQKVIFNEMLDMDVLLSPEELEFIEKLSDYQMTSEKKQLRNLIKSTMNTQITEYF
jgi:hypothetical protein